MKGEGGKRAKNTKNVKSVWMKKMVFKIALFLFRE